ncbi:MAG: autotransporter-associated beta strand repeat-containing protein, partial [Verrucomicrobiales bacterium]|nr:autotransporter-associated beta strand repeat-containing protein [Verrucomicrobiales bacterium]
GGFSLDVVEGGILVTPTVGGTASIGNGQLTSSGGELIIHNYHGAGGGFTISAAITGAVDVTFSGDANGTTLSGNNTYTGVTRINGGTVTIDSASRLGSGAANLEMRGGTLATTAGMFLSNRTVILGGDGGTFQVAAGTTNTLGRIQSESNFLAATRMNNGHGDLIKTGQGTLELTYSIQDERTQTTNTYQGLTDIREGILRVKATNSFALGSSKSFYDGTVVRSGATLAIASNLNNIAYNLREWLTLEQGSTLRLERQTTGYSSPNIDGVINFVGDATVWVESHEHQFNEAAGYMMGSGSLIKDGNAGLHLMAYSPEFTGGVVVMDGYLEDYGYENSAIPNASSITIGLNDSTDRGTLGFLVRNERNGVGTTWDINPDIIVQGNSGTTRLGTRRSQHNDVVNFNGDIDMSNFNANRDLQIYFERDISNRDASGGDEWREESFVNFTGDISGGNRRLRTVIDQVGGPYANGAWTQSVEAVDGVQPTNEPNFMVFWTFSGSNASWTGSLETVTRNTADQDRQHFVRFGNNDGAVSHAIGASNQVVMRHNATLQAFGSQVTIGNLYSDGNDGGDGFWGSQLVTNSFLENGGSVAGSFTIVQTTNRTFNGVIRDGTYHSPTSTNLAAAALSIIKDGAGILTFDRSNYYTGTTMVRAGQLRVNGAHTGGGLYLIEGGGTLGGTGVIQSAGVVVGDGGALAPGNSPGTFTIDSDLILSNGAILSFELNATNRVAGLGINDLIQGVDNLTLDGVLNVAWSGNPVGAATTNDFWTLITYDGSLTGSGFDVDVSSLPDLSGQGLGWYVDTWTQSGEVRLAVLIPEPGNCVALLFGLASIAWLARRRKR